MDDSSRTAQRSMEDEVSPSDVELSSPAQSTTTRKRRKHLEMKEKAKLYLEKANERMSELDVSWDTRRAMAISNFATLCDRDDLELSESVKKSIAAEQAGVSVRSLYSWLEHLDDKGKFVPLDGRGSASHKHGLMADNELKLRVVAFLRSKAGDRRAVLTLPEELYRYVNVNLKDFPAVKEHFLRRHMDVYASSSSSSSASSSSSSNQAPELGPASESVSLSTIYRWMSELGWEKVQKKSSVYIDGHERPDVVQYRREFIKMNDEHSKLMYSFDKDGAKPPAAFAPQPPSESAKPLIPEAADVLDELEGITLVADEADKKKLQEIMDSRRAIQIRAPEKGAGAEE